MIRLLLAILLAATAARAEPVYVRGSEDGQAFTFAHRGSCYAVLPNHVSARSGFTLRTAVPALEGTGSVTPLRFPDADFALATVRGAAAQDCTPNWSTLRNDLRGVLRDGGTGVLTTVRPSGVVDRISVVLSSVTYEHVGVSPIDPAERTNFAKGRSGSILTVDDAPVGIAIELPPAGWGADMRVLRIDAIKGRLDRYLNGSAPPTSLPSLTTNDAAGVTYEVVSWTAIPVSPENDPTALVRPGDVPFLAEASPQGLSMRLRVFGPDGGAAALRGVEIQSDLADGESTAPRTVELYAPDSIDDRSPRRLASGGVGPDGQGTILVRPTRIEWLDVVIVDAWDPARPVRIDDLALTAMPQ